MNTSEIASVLTPAILAEVLAKAVNGGYLGPSSPRPTSRVGKEFASSLLDQHRTLQAMVIQLLIECLLAYNPGQFVDLRNEQAAKSCQQLRDLVAQGDFDAYIPVV